MKDEKVKCPKVKEFSEMSEQEQMTLMFGGIMAINQALTIMWQKIQEIEAAVAMLNVPKDKMN